MNELDIEIILLICIGFYMMWYMFNYSACAVYVNLPSNIHSCAVYHSTFGVFHV